MIEDNRQSKRNHQGKNVAFNLNNVKFFICKVIIFYSYPH